MAREGVRDSARGRAFIHDSRPDIGGETADGRTDGRTDGPGISRTSDEGEGGEWCLLV